jgi:subtilisin family serine protease
MRFDHAARLERLLDRHEQEIQLVGGASGNGALVRKDQILVVSRDADQVHERAARWIVDRHDDDAGVTVLHLRKSAQVDVCELTESLTGGARHRRLAVGPNHVLTASPHWGAGPFDDPTPTTVAMPAPAHSMSTSGRDVTVAILDTGISDHPWFDGRAWFAACGSEVRETPDSNADDRLDSVAGHGTFIAGVVLQHAPGAHLLVDRVISGDGVTDELRLLQGLSRLRAAAQAASTPIDVVSLSLGCYTHDDRPSPALRHGIDAFGHDTVFVACAGNAASERPYWPAAMKRVTAVGSLDAAGLDRAPFSNYGWWVDACAVGDQVESSFFTYDGLGPDGDESFNGYAIWSGTSFAAPRVAGVIAAKAAAQDIPAAQAAAELLDPSRHDSLPDLGVFVDAPTGGSL